LGLCPTSHENQLADSERILEVPESSCPAPKLQLGTGSDGTREASNKTKLVKCQGHGLGCSVWRKVRQHVISVFKVKYSYFSKSSFGI
jgi:hypothetical protein